MLIEKVVHSKVGFDDAHQLYSPNIEETVLDKLRSTYKDKCNWGCLVLEIVELIRMGNMEASRHMQNGTFSACVEFRVRGLIIQPDEYVCGLVVKKIDKRGMFICQGDYVAAMLSPSPVLHALQEGQKIVVRVVKAAYDKGRERISVKAAPFLPIFQRFVVWKVKVAKAEGEAAALMERVAALAAEVAGANFIHQLLYPYRAPIVRGRAVNMLELPVGETILMSYPDWVDKKTPQVVVFDDVKSDDILGYSDIQAIDPDRILIVEDYAAVMVRVLTEHIGYLTLVKELGAYDQEKNAALWNVYKSAKR